MPSMPSPIGLSEIDPELSASTGLTNDVCGRLAIFDAKNVKDQRESSVSLSEQVTPCKKEGPEEDVWSVLGCEEEDEYELVDDSEEDVLAQRDRFVQSLKGTKEEIKNQIGEKLYHAIAAIHGSVAGKLTGMFLEATESLSDLALLIFSEQSLRFHCNQALEVLHAPQQQAPAASPTRPVPSSDKTPEPASPTTPDAPGAKRSHSSHGSYGPCQFPYNGKKAKVMQPTRPFFAEITDDSGKRTRVPCRYDTSHRMYVPTGGRDVALGAKKVGTRDKTPEDSQALELGEDDADRLRARQKQIDIGMNTDGFRALMTQGLSGRALQDLIALPYITEQGTLEKTLKCSKKRYDGYVRMWKRKLYDFVAVQRMDFSSFPPIREEQDHQLSKPLAVQGAWSEKVASIKQAPLSLTSKSAARKQGAPTRHTAAVVTPAITAAIHKSTTKTWADMVEEGS